MAYSRRKFIAEGTRSVLAISASGLLQACSPLGVKTGEKVRLRFAIFSDGHYGQPGTDYDAFHTEMTGWINAEHQQKPLDFTIVNGDLLHDDPSAIPGLKKHLAVLRMPWYPCHGNHDMIDEAGWQQAFGQPYNYVVEKGNTALIFLNTADNKGKYIQEDTGWMQQQLAQHASKEHLFVIMHITPFSWSKAGFPHPEMVRLFSAQKNLKAVFHGHDHEEDGYKEHAGKYYFFDGHTGGSWGVPYRGYRIVEVMKDGRIYLTQKNPLKQTMVNSLTL